MFKFHKQIVRAREVPEKGITITEDRLKHWQATAELMGEKGLRIPAPFFHDPNAVPVNLELSKEVADSKNNAGFWSKLWLADDGWLMGELEVPRAEDAEKIGTTIKGASLYAPPKWEEGGESWEDAITHIALTNKPVIHEGADFETALSLSLDDAGGYDAASDEGDSDKNSSTNLESALKVLSELGLELPDDTTDQNFLQRVCIAGTAVLSHQKKNKKDGEGVTQMPQGAKVKKPSPIAMATETTTALSVEQLFFNNQVASKRKEYRDRCEKLIKRKAIAPADVKKFMDTKIDAVPIALSTEGEIMPNEVDAILEVWERLPDNAALNALAMSGEGTETHDPPQTRLSTEQVDEITNKFFKNVGLA